MNGHVIENNDNIVQTQSIMGRPSNPPWVVPSVPTRLLSMEVDGAHATPLPLSMLRFTGIQSYSYTDQRKVEADVEVTEDRTGDLSLRKPRTSRLSHDCS